MINKRLLIWIIAIFAALPPFAIDTYSPAIPNIANYFELLPAKVMLTFTTYFIGFSLGILIWGPLSDVYGRKKILFIGSGLYVVSSILCPLSTHFMQLELARVGQGFGDAACATVAFAIVRDCFSGKILVKTMATLGTIMMVAPIIAPTIGVIIINLSNRWQDIFHFLTGYGVFLVLLCFIVPETLEQGSEILKISDSFKTYWYHATNYKFIILAAGAALGFAASFSFIGSSAIIYLKLYNTTRLEYAGLFAINGFTIMLANFILRQINNYMSVRQILMLALGGALLTTGVGYFLISIFSHSLLLFLIIMCSTIFFIAISSNLLTATALNNVPKAFGSASSVTTCFKFLFAGIANWVMADFSVSNLNKTLLIQQFILLLIVAVCLIPVRKFNYT